MFGIGDYHRLEALTLSLLILLCSGADFECPLLALGLHDVYKDLCRVRQLSMWDAKGMLLNRLKYFHWGDL